MIYATVTATAWISTNTIARIFVTATTWIIVTATAWIFTIATGRIFASATARISSYTHFWIGIMINL